MNPETVRALTSATLRFANSACERQRLWRIIERVGRPGPDQLLDLMLSPTFCWNSARRHLRSFLFSMTIRRMPVDAMINGSGIKTALWVSSATGASVGRIMPVVCASEDLAVAVLAIAKCTPATFRKDHSVADRICCCRSCRLYFLSRTSRGAEFCGRGCWWRSRSLRSGNRLVHD